MFLGLEVVFWAHDFLATLATSHFGFENIEAIGQHRRGDHGANIDEESIDEANIGKFYVKVFLS